MEIIWIRISHVRFQLLRSLSLWFFDIGRASPVVINELFLLNCTNSMQNLSNFVYFTTGIASFFFLSSGNWAIIILCAGFYRRVFSVNLKFIPNFHFHTFITPSRSNETPLFFVNYLLLKRKQVLDFHIKIEQKKWVITCGSMGISQHTYICNIYDTVSFVWENLSSIA